MKQLCLFDETHLESLNSCLGPHETAWSPLQEKLEACRKEALRESASLRMQSWQSKLDGRDSSRIERVPVGLHGARMGQWHPRALYADAEIEMVFALRDEGLSISAIARKLEMPRSTVGAIVSGRLRCATPEGWKLKEVKV